MVQLVQKENLSGCKLSQRWWRWNREDKSGERGGIREREIKRNAKEERTDIHKDKEREKKKKKEG